MSLKNVKEPFFNKKVGLNKTFESLSLMKIREIQYL